MRGFPVLRLILVATALALLALPVWSLTGQSRPAQPVRVPSPDESPRLADYRVVLTVSVPATIEIAAANQSRAASEGAVKNFETKFSMSAGKPEDLVVSARFQNSAEEAALRVQVEKDGQPVVDRTLWGVGEIEDVVEVPIQ